MADAKTIEFFFDFGSPTTYLAHTQLPRIARDGGVTLIYRPMLLGAVFKATGNASPVSIAAKGRWMAGDIALWAAHYGVPFSFNPFFPINTLSLMRAATGIQMKQPGDFERFVDVVFSAMWVEPRNLGAPAVLADLLSAAGFEPNAMLELLALPDVKARLIESTEEAVARGVFGAPTMFVGKQMFFGQDRLQFVQAALTAAQA